MRDSYSLNNTMAELGTILCESELISDYITGISENNTSVLCPQNNNYTLSGSFSSTKFKYLTVIVSKWSILLGDTNCATDAEINSKLDGAAVGLVVGNSYMDFDDYDTVIKSYVDDRFTYTIRSGTVKIPQIYVRK